MDKDNLQKIVEQINNDQRSLTAIYTTLFDKLKDMAQDQLIDQEIHTATRNLIDFCQEIVNYKLKKKKIEGQIKQNDNNYLNLIYN